MKQQQEMMKKMQEDMAAQTQAAMQAQIAAALQTTNEEMAALRKEAEEAKKEAQQEKMRRQSIQGSLVSNSGVTASVDDEGRPVEGSLYDDLGDSVSVVNAQRAQAVTTPQNIQEMVKNMVQQQVAEKMDERAETLVRQEYAAKMELYETKLKEVQEENERLNRQEAERASEVSELELGTPASTQG